MQRTFGILDFLRLAIRNRDTRAKQSTRQKEHILSILFNIIFDQISGTKQLYWECSALTEDA